MLLAGVVNAGTGQAAALPGGALGKTGTSQDFRDALFIGWTGSLVAGVWIGRDDNAPLDAIAGGDLPARIWRDFMLRADPQTGGGGGAGTRRRGVSGPIRGRREYWRQFRCHWSGLQCRSLQAPLPLVPRFRLHIPALQGIAQALHTVISRGCPPHGPASLRAQARRNRSCRLRKGWRATVIRATGSDRIRARRWRDHRRAALASIQIPISTIIRFSVSETRPSGTFEPPPTPAHLSSRSSMWIAVTTEFAPTVPKNSATGAEFHTSEPAAIRMPTKSLWKVSAAWAAEFISSSAGLRPIEWELASKGWNAACGSQASSKCRFSILRTGTSEHHAPCPWHTHDNGLNMFTRREQPHTRPRGEGCLIGWQARRWQEWRRGWDSNPRWSCPHAAFRVRYFRPLSHLSASLVGASSVRGRLHNQGERLAQGVSLPSGPETAPDSQFGLTHRPV